MVTKPVLMSLCTVLALSGPSTATAEDAGPIIFLDVYGGYTWSQDQDADSKLTVAGVPGMATLHNLDVGNGPAFGGKIGMWFDAWPHVGIAIDTTRFDTDIDRQTTRLTVSPDPVGTSRTLGTTDIRIANVSVSFDLILRRRMGRWQPYVAAGPAMVFSNLDEGGFFGNGIDKEDDNVLDFGYKVTAGTSYALNDTMHIFAEYKYLEASPEYKLEESVDPVTLPPTTTREKLSIDINTHAFFGGVSIRF